jgi:tRNA(Arg) A34 adenosine deaminase TadA
MRKEFISKAIEQAERSSQNFKHGAIIVKNKKIISLGHNKISSKVPSHLYSIHAEMAAIKGSSKNVTNSHCYVVRVNTYGLAESKPCEKCQQFMKMHGVTRVFYSTGSKLEEFKSLYI